MEHRVVALAKGDGFEEVLVALDASADAEYPVVEGTGGMWGLGSGHQTGGGMSPACPCPPGSPTLVGTVRRAQLVTFLQSHKHPQAPPGEKVNGGASTPLHPKKLVFHPKINTSPSPSWPPRGRLGTTVPLSPSCYSSRRGPPCTRFGVGGDTSRWGWEPPTPPQLCIPGGDAAGWLCPHTSPSSPPQGPSPLRAAEAAAHLRHPFWGAGGSRQPGGGEGGTRRGGQGGGTSPSPTSSVPLQLRRAIEELANPK